MQTTEDLKITFLGVNPVIKDETGDLNPETICALGALLTFKGKSVQDLKKEVDEKGQDLGKKVKIILEKSSLKGHASIATTPVFSFSYEASKFLDSSLTGIVFASALMHSGRRAGVTNEDVVIPVSLEKNKKSREIYLDASKRNIDLFNKLLVSNVEQDQASKILHYGLYGTGIISYSVESLNSLKREYEREKYWMPEEIEFLLKIIERKMQKTGIGYLFRTRQVAPRNTYPYPNIFKDPTKVNLARELAEKYLHNKESKVISINSLATDGLKKRMDNLKEKLERIYEDKKILLSKWYNLLEERASITRDYQNALDVKVLSRESWRVWGEKKRHRTVQMGVDSIYYSIERAYNIWKGYKENIEKNSLVGDQIAKLDNFFAIPEQIRANKKLLGEYLSCAWNSLCVYKKLVESGIPERDAIFIVPRAVRIDMVSTFNFYNLISGYYPLRLCTKAEEQLRRVTTKEAEEIKSEFKKIGLDWLNWHIAPKCYSTGFCPEEESCLKVKEVSSFYNEEVHEEMKKDLEEKLQETSRKPEQVTLRESIKAQTKVHPNREEGAFTRS